MHTCFLVGAAPEAVRIVPQPGDFVIAADGGYQHLMHWNVTPNLIVGDMDSLHCDLPQGILCIKLPAKKDHTDLAFALEAGIDRGFKHFVITGASGGRIDHSFANIQLLAKAAKLGMGAVLLDKKFEATVLIGPGKLELKGHGTISVFAYSSKAQGVTITGMKYDLTEETLMHDTPRGISNELYGRGCISVEDGILLIFQMKEIAR